MKACIEPEGLQPSAIRTAQLLFVDTCCGLNEQVAAQSDGVPWHILAHYSDASLFFSTEFQRVAITALSFLSFFIIMLLICFTRLNMSTFACQYTVKC